jgi:hypothetical protein
MFAEVSLRVASGNIDLDNGDLLAVGADSNVAVKNGFSVVFSASINKENSFGKLIENTIGKLSLTIELSVSSDEFRASIKFPDIPMGDKKYLQLGSSLLHDD